MSQAHNVNKTRNLAKHSVKMMNPGALIHVT